MTVLLVRHAHAGRREPWKGDDFLRPLSGKGQRQAKALAVELADFVADAGRDVRILSSPYTRCRETIVPLAAALKVSVGDADSLREGRGGEAIALVSELARGTGVVCTHGDVVVAVLEWLEEQGVDVGPRPLFPKASTWVLEARKGVYRAAHYLPPPR